jgi:hypothetical protein
VESAELCNRPRIYRPLFFRDKVLPPNHEGSSVTAEAQGVFLQPAHAAISARHHTALPQRHLDETSIFPKPANSDQVLVCLSRNGIQREGKPQVQTQGEDDRERNHLLAEDP